jgi:chorismate mutase
MAPTGTHPLVSSRLQAVRGATTLVQDTPDAMRQEVTCLLEALISENHITTQDIVSVFFTLTPDLHSISPAKVARERFDWENIALFSGLEPQIEGLPKQAVRVMIQFYTTRTAQELKHLYFNEAQTLRPDRTSLG